MNLVTGATGLVGAHLLHYLSLNGDTVRAIKRPTSNLHEVEQIFNFYNNPNYNRIQWVDGDILDITSLDESFKGIQNVFHAAAIVSFDKRDRKKLYETNVIGTRNVINAAIGKNVNQIGYISSIAALGRKANTNTYTENNKWVESKKNSYYSITKNLAELEVWRGIEEGLNAVMINPGVIIGPGNINQSSGTLFKSVLDGLNYFTEGVNGFVDVRDAAKTIIELVHKNVTKERYICVGENISYKDLFSNIAVSLDKKPPQKEASPSLTNLAWKLEAFRTFFTRKTPLITKETAQTSHGKNYYNNEKLIQELDYKFHTINEAINNASEYIKEHYGKR